MELPQPGQWWCEIGRHWIKGQRIVWTEGDPDAATWTRIACPKHAEGVAPERDVLGLAPWARGGVS